MLKLPFDDELGNITVSQGVGGTYSHSDTKKNGAANVVYTGLDFDLDRGEAVYAIAPGVVTAIYDEATDFWSSTTYKNGVVVEGAQDSIGAGGFGNYVTVLHTAQTDSGRESFYVTYAHLEQDSSDALFVGQFVSYKTQIGQVGWTGYITGDHLHIHVGKELFPGAEYADGRSSAENLGLIQELSFGTRGGGSFGGNGKSYEKLAGSFTGEDRDGSDNFRGQIPVEKMPDQAADKHPDKFGSIDPEGRLITIDFEEAPSPYFDEGGTIIIDDYMGLTWGNFSTLDAIAYGSGEYSKGLTSGRHLAYNPDNRQTAFWRDDDDGNFDLKQGYFTGPGQGELLIEVYVWADGQMVAEDEIIISGSGPTLHVFDERLYSNIDEVQFNVFGPLDAYGSNGAGFLLDDLTLVQLPPDDSLLM